MLTWHFRKKGRSVRLEIAATQQTIGALQTELHDARACLDAQGLIVQDVAGIGGELREAKKRYGIIGCGNERNGGHER